MAPTESTDSTKDTNQTTALTDGADGTENANQTEVPTGSTNGTENENQSMAPTNITDSTENTNQNRPPYLKRLKSALKSFKTWTKSAVEQQQPRSSRDSTGNLSGETLVGTEDLEASLEALHIWSA